MAAFWQHALRLCSEHMSRLFLVVGPSKNYTQTEDIIALYKSTPNEVALIRGVFTDDIE